MPPPAFTAPRGSLPAERQRRHDPSGDICGHCPIPLDCLPRSLAAPAAQRIRGGLAEDARSTHRHRLHPSRQQTAALADRHRWVVAVDGAQWRRVVPSLPRRIVEQGSITQLLQSGSVVVCGGGGGVPVVTDDNGQVPSVEAVIDKDLTPALLAIKVRADRLLVLTEVPAVMADSGTPQAVPLRTRDLDELNGMQFPAAAMGPKIAACRAFVAATGRPAGSDRRPTRPRSSPAPPEPPSPPARNETRTPEPRRRSSAAPA